MLCYIKKPGLAPLLVIILLISLSQVSETIYAVSLPQIAINLSTSQSLTEYTLTSYFIGFACSILLWGYLSDKIGRRPGLFLGLGIYIIASLLCWFSDSIQYLIIMRFIQGFGASVGSVLGQAIIRDIIAPKDRAAIFAAISIAMSFAPAIGLAVGSVIIQNFHWSAIFIILIIFAAVIMVSILLFIPETNLNLNLKQSHYLFSKCFNQIIQDSKGLRLGFLVGGVMGLLFGYFAESSFYFIEILAMSPMHYGLLAFLICIPLTTGSVISRAINYLPDQIILFGVLILFFGSICFFVLTNSGMIVPGGGLRSILLSIVCIYIILTAVSMIIPNCLNQILSDYGEYTGTAASIFGFYYYAITAIFTALMAILHDGTIHSLPLFFVIISGLALILCKKK